MGTNQNGQTPLVAAGQAILDPGLQWINFFNGRLLSGEDLTQERTAGALSRQRLGQAIGDGIVWGLQVIPQKLNSILPADLMVKVKPGLAINRSGVPLALDAEVSVALTTSPAAAAAVPLKSNYFSACLGIQPGGGYQGGGAYLLTLFPAEGPSQELAAISGLGTGSPGCTYRYRKEGIQFRLLPIDPQKQLGLSEDDLKPSAAPLLRSRLASAIFGLEGSSLWRGLEELTLPFDPLAFLRSDPVVSLSDCDVPLALIFATDNGGIQFVDMASVRRRVSPRPADELWGLVPPGGAGSVYDRLGDRWAGIFGDRQLSTTEAFFLQFEEQLLDLLDQAASQPALKQQDLSATFAYLPALGIVPVAGNGSLGGFNQAGFFGARVLGNPAVISQGDLAALFQKALSYPPRRVEDIDLLQLYWVSENLSAVASDDSDQRYLVFVSREVQGPLENDAVVATLKGAWDGYNSALQKGILLPQTTIDKALPIWTALYTRQQLIVQYAMTREALALAGRLNRPAVRSVFQDLYDLQKDLSATLVLTFDGDNGLAARQRFAAELKTYLDSPQPTPSSSGLKQALSDGRLPPILKSQAAINKLIGTWTGEVAFGFLKLENPSSPRGTQLVPGDGSPFPFTFKITNFTDKVVKVSLQAEVLGVQTGDWSHAVSLSTDSVTLGLTQGSPQVTANITVPPDAQPGQNLTLRLTASLPPPNDTLWTYDVPITTAEKAGDPVFWSLNPVIGNRPAAADDALPDQTVTIIISTLFSASRPPTSLSACTFTATFTFANSQRSDWGILIQAAAGSVKEDPAGVLKYSFPLPATTPNGAQSSQIKITAPSLRGSEDKTCSFAVDVSGTIMDEVGKSVDISAHLDDPLNRLRVTLKKQ